MKIKIKFEDIYDNVETLEQAYDVFLQYLNQCVHHDDVSAFDFEEVEEEQSKQDKVMPIKPKNETILIAWKGVLFSENVYAWFEFDQPPVISDKLEDLCLPEDFHFEKTIDDEEGFYMINAYDEDSKEYLYAGRLFTPKGKPLW
jgi:hypothetical protein